MGSRRGRDGPQWALVQLIYLLNLVSCPAVFSLRCSSDRLTCAVSNLMYMFFHFLAVGVSLDTSAAFTSDIGGAAPSFLFEGLGVRRGVEHLHCPGRLCVIMVGKDVAREHQMTVA